MKAQKSLKTMLRYLVVLPLVFLSVIVLTLSVWQIYTSTMGETEDGLKNLAHALLEVCNRTGNGDYVLTANGDLTKGGLSFDEDHLIVDQIKQVSGIDATIFYGDTRVRTTIRSAAGERAVGTRASQDVVRVVLGTGGEYFSSRVLVNQTPYFGYYIPLKNLDQSNVGMVFVGKPRAQILAVIRRMILITALAELVIIAVTLFVALTYAQNIIYSLNKTKEFLGQVAHGNLECQIDPYLLGRKDELGEMGRFAVMLRDSITKAVGTDPLTGLYNRRCGEVMLQNAIDEFQSKNVAFSVAIGDIDDFKAINDTFGHQAGDQVLKALSALFLSTLEDRGLVCRWGGEEFLFLFVKAGLKQAVPQLKELLETVQKLEIPSQNGMIRFRMTFGIAEFSGCDTMDTIIKKADNRLYYGKCHGKNQIVSQ